MARIIRDQRRRDLIAAIAEWERATGPDRVWWRRDARHRLAEWRRLYRIPERAAFQQAVANRLKSQVHIPQHPARAGAPPTPGSQPASQLTANATVGGANSLDQTPERAAFQAAVARRAAG